MTALQYNSGLAAAYSSDDPPIKLIHNPMRQPNPHNGEAEIAALLGDALYEPLLFRGLATLEDFAPDFVKEDKGWEVTFIDKGLAEVAYRLSLPGVSELEIARLERKQAKLFERWDRKVRKIVETWYRHGFMVDLIPCERYLQIMAEPHRLDELTLHPSELESYQPAACCVA
jgi:hypothetical protein